MVLSGSPSWTRAMAGEAGHSREAVCAARGPQELAESRMRCAMMITMTDGAC